MWEEGGSHIEKTKLRIKPATVDVKGVTTAIKAPPETLDQILLNEHSIHIYDNYITNNL